MIIAVIPGALVAHRLVSVCCCNATCSINDVWILCEILHLVFILLYSIVTFPLQPAWLNKLHGLVHILHVL